VADDFNPWQWATFVTDAAATIVQQAPEPETTGPEPGDQRTIAMAQIVPRLGDLAHNLDLHLARIEEARQGGADLIVFPELSLTGYFVRDMVPELARGLDSDEVQQLAAAAGPCDLVFGMIEDDRHGRYRIAAVYVRDGRVAHVHRKVYLPTYGLFDEKRYFAPGDRIAACSTPSWGQMGLLVCEDLWHLSAVTVLQAEGVDLLVAIANSPGRGIDGPRVRTAEIYERMCRTYAEMLGAVVVFVNRAGFEDGLCFWGGSMAVGPDGQVLSQAPHFDEALVYTRYRMADLRRRRTVTPLARDENLLLTIEELQRVKRQRYEGRSAT